MARHALVDEEELLSRLTRVFRDVGYDGASLAQLADAAQLKRASLYHRFPGGKAEMARAVLAAASDWLGEHVIAPLTASGPPAARLERAAANLAAFYDDGETACLLNLLSSPDMADGPFGDEIRRSFQTLIEAFARLAQDAGLDQATAARRAERAVMMMQGALVLSRGLGATAPFETFLQDLPDDLLKPAA